MILAEKKIKNSKKSALFPKTTAVIKVRFFTKTFDFIKWKTRKYDQKEKESLKVLGFVFQTDLLITTGVVFVLGLLKILIFTKIFAIGRITSTDMLFVFKRYFK